VLAEEMGSELDEGGASLEDLVDSVRLLHAMNREPVPDLCLSIPFLKEGGLKSEVQHLIA
jgi:hypothetical protein